MHKKILGLFVLLIVLGAASWQLINFSNQISETEVDLTKESNNNLPAGLVIEAVNMASLIIDNGIDAPQNFDLEIASTTTAFDLLKIATASASTTLKFKEYEIGVLIEQIGEQKNGTDDKYWMYYVNDEMPMVASDKQLISPSDTISFRFEESSF